MNGRTAPYPRKMAIVRGVGVSPTAFGLAEHFAAWCKSLARRVAAPLLIELHLLDGVTWRFIGLTVLVGALLSVGDCAALIRDEPWLALHVLDDNVTAGLLILFTGAALLNLRRPQLPRPAALIIAVLFGSLIGVVLDCFPRFLHLYQPDRGLPGDTLFYWREWMAPWAFAAAAWYFVQRANARASALREREIGRQRLEMRMAEARLAVMQAQVEPHFLFNTLANVKHLCQIDPAIARRMLDRFCDYLRAALPRMRGNRATLGSELELARAYLDIQQIRMGRRLSVEIDVPAALGEAVFPPMMLISLVENAVKHGLSPLSGGGSIRIGAVASDSRLCVSVADTGQGLAKCSGSGIGLSNIQSRLVSLYGLAAELSLAANLPRGFVATIALPIVPSPAASGERIDSHIHTA